MNISSLTCLGILLTALVGCGGRDMVEVRREPEVILVDGVGIFAVRRNPPGCLRDRPDLHMEVRTPTGWERVALENTDEEQDLVAGLRARFIRDPWAEISARVRFTSDVRLYGDNHAARVVRLLELDPPPEPP